MKIPRSRRISVTVIPAQPGWKILRWVPADEQTEGEVYCSGDVIAFQIEVFQRDDGEGSLCTIATPISLVDVEDGEAIEKPDGRVTLPLAGDFESREDLTKYWLSIQKLRQARGAA